MHLTKGQIRLANAAVYVLALTTCTLAAQSTADNRRALGPLDRTDVLASFPAVAIDERGLPMLLQLPAEQWPDPMAPGEFTSALRDGFRLLGPGAKNDGDFTFHFDPSHVDGLVQQLQGSGGDFLEVELEAEASGAALTVTLGYIGDDSEYYSRYRVEGDVVEPLEYGDLHRADVGPGILRGLLWLFGVVAVGKIGLRFVPGPDTRDPV